MKHFFIVGAQRSGTTYLHNILKEHPDIVMASPSRPEPKYFMNKTKDGISLNEYHNSFFKKARSTKKIFGEKSTSYYEREDAPMLISSLLPNAKIIFLLRNPVERAISNYFFSLNHGLETRSINEVFIEEKEEPDFKGANISTNPFDYLGRGMYSVFIENYLKWFKSNQIKIIIFESFVNNLERIQDLYKFLNVDYKFEPKNSSLLVNTSYKDFVVPETVLRKLRQHYKDQVTGLEELTKLNLASWKI